MGAAEGIIAPKQDEMTGAAGFAAVQTLLGPHESVEVKQIDFSGCDCCCCFRRDPCKGFPCCCCLASSEFMIQGPDGQDLLFANEKSNTCERICCSPNHSLLMNVMTADGVPPPTKVVGRRVKKNIHEEGTLDDVPKLLTLERKGCCNGYMVCCCSCFDCCNDNMAVYEGDVQGTPGKLLDAPPVMTMISQPIGGGGCTPTINIESKGGGSPMTIEGPPILGGWAEMVADSDFKVSSNGQQVATIRHKKPKSFCELLMAFLTPLDSYKVSFEGQLSAQDKANIVLSSFLVDYMFFEMDNGPCSCDGESVTCTFFYCSCFGCLCPCQCTARKPENGD